MYNYVLTSMYLCWNSSNSFQASWNHMEKLFDLIVIRVFDWLHISLTGMVYSIPNNFLNSSPDSHFPCGSEARFIDTWTCSKESYQLMIYWLYSYIKLIY